jgi:hypothetical protein
MFRKMLLAGAVVFAGSLFTSKAADAHYGPVVRYGSPMVRTYNPYVAPRYGYRSGFRGPVYGGSMYGGSMYGRPMYGGPVYRSYRGPVGFGPGFGGPMYGPGFGPGFGRTGISIGVGPVWRGW